MFLIKINIKGFYLMENLFDNYETSYFSTDSGYVCSYCGNTQLVIDDAIDEHGNCWGTRYYCECEQAKLEQEMKHKISALTREGLIDLIAEVKKEYAPKLQQNNTLIQEIKFKNDFSTFIKNNLYSYHTWLQDKSNVELLDMLKDLILPIRSLYERRNYDDTFEKEDITIAIHNYGLQNEYWEVYICDDEGERFSHLSKDDMINLSEVENYIEELKDKYNVIVKQNK